MNIPNLLSLLRLILVPVFSLTYFSDISYAHIYAGIIFAVAGLTDLADGYIARRFNMITPLGRVLDPLADKLMQVTAIACLTIDKQQRLPAFILIIFACKELFMLLGGVTLLRKTMDVIPSNPVGKAASAFISGVILLSFFIQIPRTVLTLLFCMALGFTLASFFAYSTIFKNSINKKHNNDNE